MFLITLRFLCKAMALHRKFVRCIVQMRLFCFFISRGRGSRKLMCYFLMNLMTDMHESYTKKEIENAEINLCNYIVWLYILEYVCSKLKMSKST